MVASRRQGRSSSEDSTWHCSSRQGKYGGGGGDSSSSSSAISSSFSSLRPRLAAKDNNELSQHRGEIRSLLKRLSFSTVE